MKPHERIAARLQGVHRRACAPLKLVIDGCPPGWGAKNRKFKGRQGKVLTEEYQRFQDEVWAEWMRKGQRRFETGGVVIDVRTYWKRKRTFDDGYITAFADVDAVMSAILDALQDKVDRKGNLVERRCIDNDMRVIKKTTEKFVDKDHPRVEVVLRTV